MKYTSIILILLFTFSVKLHAIKSYSLDSILGEKNIIVKTYKWVDKTFNSFDTAYVAGTGKHFNFKLKNDNWIDAYTFKINNGANVRMMSDVCCFVGASIGYRAVSISYMMDVQNAFRTNSPSRKRADFSFTCSKISFNVFYDQNLGKTNIIRYGIGNDIKSVNQEFSGLNSESFGVSAYYIFNSQKYSYAAAYGFSRIQKRNAGSFFLGTAISSHNIKLDFSKLPPNMEDIFAKSPLDYNFKYNDYSIIVGYGYNLVFAKRWLLGASLLPTIGIKHSYDGYSDGNKNLFSINSAAKISVVYNISRYFAGIVGQYNAYFYIADKYALSNLIGSFNVSAGVRF